MALSPPPGAPAVWQDAGRAPFLLKQGFVAFDGRMHAADPEKMWSRPLETITSEWARFSGALSEWARLATNGAAEGPLAPARRPAHPQGRGGRGGGGP